MDRASKKKEEKTKEEKKEEQATKIKLNPYTRFMIGR